MLRDVLSGEEAARMVAIAERMGFEVGEGAGAGRTSAAVSWCFHEDLTLTLTIALALALTLTLTLTRCFHEGLAEQLIRRMAPHLPWAVGWG